MGNVSSNATSSPRLRSVSPRGIRGKVSKVELRNLTSPRRRQRSGPVSYPRDPTTGRYLPRGTTSRRQSVEARTSPVRSRRSASPRRRVEVEVISTPRVERYTEVEAKPEVRAPRQRRQSNQSTVTTTRSKQRVSFTESPILRSNYTRAVEEPLEQAEVPVRRPRSRVHAETQEAAAPQTQEAVSSPRATTRRDYASPSLAEPAANIGPSTVRRVRRMASVEAPSTVPTPPPQVERLSQTSPGKQGDMSELLFSYLNAP